MGDSDMIFGGTEKLKDMLELCVSRGHDRICVITSCPSGIIGDDVKSVVSTFRNGHPEIRIALIESDGNLNGDFMQGVIDASISLCETFSEECEKTDSVNLIGTKSLALNCMTAAETVKEMLGRLGVEVNCIFPAGDSIDSIARIRSARLNIMTNPDLFTIQIGTYLDERFGIPFCPVPVRPGIRGTISWLSYVADVFGKQKELDEFSKALTEEYESQLSQYRKVLEGKRFCMLSATRDIDWILEATESVGMERVRTVVVDRTDYCNDMNVTNEFPNISFVKSIDIATERKIIEDMKPDMVISTVPIGVNAPHISIPLVQIPGPFTGVDFIRRVAATLLSSRKEGWRKDVV